MESSPSQPAGPLVPLSADLEALTSVYSEASAYLAKLTKLLEELETTQTTLLQSYHATSTALADIRGYNTVAPAMELLPVYTAKVARLKQLMGQQRQTVDRMKVRVEEVRKIKAANHERLMKKWEGERQRDKSLAARMVGVVERNNKSMEEIIVAAKEAGVDKVVMQKEVSRVFEPASSSSTSTAARTERQVERQEAYQGSETPLDASGPSLPSTTTTVVTKTVVKRKKKARQAEIE